MRDTRYLTSGIILGASPLIYLAKLEALDVLATAAEKAHITPTVLEEVTRPQVVYRHPDAVVIEKAVAAGLIGVLRPSPDEEAMAADILRRVPGLDRGETEVLAVAITRSIAAVIFERRARRVAASLGARLVDVTEMIVVGTADPALREERILRFARMVDMRLDDAMDLLARVRSGRLG